MAKWTAKAWVVLRSKADLLKSAFLPTGFLLQNGSEDHLGMGTVKRLYAAAGYLKKRAVAVARTAPRDDGLVLLGLPAG
jgi:hypothetical protein